MVQKYKSPVRIYTHPFEIVMAAYEKRFPTCPMIPVFISSEIMNEEISEGGAIHVVERRCKLNVDAPYLLKKLVGVDYCIFIQKNTLDRRRRVLRIEAHNESFSSRIIVNERCVYSIHPENPEWTCFEQEAGLEIKSFFGFEKAVEKIAIQQYSQNIKKGKEVIEYYINELTASGVTYIPPWRPNCTIDVSSSVSDASVVDGNTVDSTVISETVHIHLHNPQFVSSSPSHPAGTLPVNNNLSALHAHSHHSHHLVASGSRPPGSHDASQPDDFSDSAFLSLSTASLVDPVASPSPPTAGVSKDLKSKLSAEFIRRNLGDLTPGLESALVQLREMLAESHKNLDKLPKYSVMLRFLRAHADPEGDGTFIHVERAHDMLCRSLAWRKMHAVDRLLETYEPPTLLSKCSVHWPCGWHGNDKQGRPVYILRLGRLDIKGVLRSLGVAAVIKHVLAAEEEGIRLQEMATRESHAAVTTCVCVVDLEGLSMRHLWRPGVKFFLDLLNILTQHYPESLSQMLIVRAPLIFPFIWALTAPFLDERTRSKFMVYAGHDCLGLTDFIDADSLPVALGGNCKCGAACCAVGEPPQISFVPKSQYQYSVLELERDGLPLSDDYCAVQLCAHYPHEVALWVTQPGSLITWDFDVVRGDVTFSLYYTGDSHPLTEPRHVHSACQNAQSASRTVQFLDPKCTPSSQESGGTDSFAEMVEKTVHCRDGDSLQGSHVAQRVGAYVLQWRMRPASATSAGSTCSMTNLPSPTSTTSPPAPNPMPSSLATPSVAMTSSTASGNSNVSQPLQTTSTDSLFASAMSSIAAATSGRVTLVYYADLLPMSTGGNNPTSDTTSNISSVSVDAGLGTLVTASETVTACWQSAASAASLPSPGSSSSNFAAFFVSSSATVKQGPSSGIVISFEEKINLNLEKISNNNSENKNVAI